VGIKKMMAILVKSKKDNFLFISCILLILSSCGSTIGVRSPLNSFISPEAAGETFKGEVNGFLSIASKNNIELDDSSGTIKKTVSQDNEVEDTIGLNGTMGIIERLDVVVISPGSKTPTLLGLKYQVIGQGRTKAVKGNHSLSIVALLGNQESTQENDDAVEFVATDEEATGDMQIESTDIRLIYGYRFENRKMVYGGLSSVKINYDVELSSDNLAFDNREISGAASAIGAHLGMAFYAKEAFNLKVEAAGQKIKWDDHKEVTIGTVIASLGLFWN
jgi:hypothetical protein